MFSFLFLYQFKFILKLTISGLHRYKKDSDLIRLIARFSAVPSFKASMSLWKMNDKLSLTCFPIKLNLVFVLSHSLMKKIALCIFFNAECKYLYYKARRTTLFHAKYMYMYY